jgi:hypothetical protein
VGNCAKKLTAGVGGMGTAAGSGLGGVSSLGTSTSIVVSWTTGAESGADAGASGVTVGVASSDMTGVLRYFHSVLRKPRSLAKYQIRSSGSKNSLRHSDFFRTRDEWLQEKVRICCACKLVVLFNFYFTAS